MPASIEAIIDRQLRLWELERKIATARPAVTAPPPVTHPVITVSREHGSRGREIAAGLAERFQYTLLDRNAIERISESTGYLRRLLEALDEHARSWIQETVDSMVWGNFVDERDYARGLFKTVHSIASLGGVVVVGRGASFIIGPAGGVHLRIIAPFEERLRRLAGKRNLTETEAEREIHTVDAERSKFVRKLYGRAVNDPLAYDITVNESGWPLEELVDFLTIAARKKIERLRNGAATVAA